MVVYGEYGVGKMFMVWCYFVKEDYLCIVYGFWCGFGSKKGCVVYFSIVDFLMMRKVVEYILYFFEY